MISFLAVEIQSHRCRRGCSFESMLWSLVLRVDAGSFSAESALALVDQVLLARLVYQVRYLVDMAHHILAVAHHSDGSKVWMNWLGFYHDQVPHLLH